MVTVVSRCTAFALAPDSDNNRSTHPISMSVSQRNHLRRGTQHSDMNRLRVSRRTDGTKRPTPGRPLRFLIVLAGGCLLILGLFHGFQGIHSTLQQKISSRERYLFDFHAIDCPTPPASDRLSFLAEVRYLSQYPPRFSILSPDLAESLRAAFASHPWVAEVRSVTIASALPRQVHVDLRFRTPVLQVTLVQGPPRWVDEQGILLPPLNSYPSGGMPGAVLRTPRLPPDIPAGRQWEDPIVLQALALVQAYQPRQLEYRQQHWELILADGRILHVAARTLD